MAVPPAVPPVSDTNRYIAYTVNGASTSTVSVPFPVYGDASDLTVILDGTTAATSSWSLISASGSPLGNLSQPITDGQIFFSPNVSPTVIEVVGSIHPRQASMPTQPGLARREFNQTIGYLLSICRELYRKLTLPLQLGFDASGPLANRTQFDSQAQGYRFLRTDDPSARPLLYIKNSATVGDWSQPLNFQGPNGAQGPAGAGTVTSVGSGNGLTGGPITGSGSLILDPTQFGWGFRNRIINGQMLIDQRNAGASYTIGTVNGLTNYTLDRWYIALTPAATGIYAQQVTILSAGINRALTIGRVNGSTSTPQILCCQVIETANCIDLQGKNITLSFAAAAGANFSAGGGQVVAAIYYGTGIDQSAATFMGGTWPNFASVAASVITLTPGGGFQTFVVQGQVPAFAMQLGVRFYFSPTGTAGANDWLMLTNVQLEQGSVAAAQVSPERKPIQIELALCERYFQKSWDLGSVVNSGYSGAMARTLDATQSYASLQEAFGVNMRTDPAVTIYSPVTGAAGMIRNVTAAVDVAAAVAYAGQSGIAAYVNNVSVSAQQWIAAHYSSLAEM